MSAIDKIKAPIDKELSDFEPYFSESMKSKVPLLGIITNYIYRRKGKQMRPMLVFLSAKLNGGITESTYAAAALIELLHTATLIHDDVVDESDTRRGFFSINALWRSKIAVLVGDYLLSKGLLLAVAKKEFELLGIVSEAVREMAEGELLQIEKARNLNITEDIYFEVIRKKTATLIASCAASGAKSAGCNDETVENMRKLGEYIGIAFQIKDDLFDYEEKNLVGKPTGNDIQERKMTLPIIYALKNASITDKKRILNIFKKKKKTSAMVAEIVDFTAKAGGLNYAAEKMNEYKNMAIDIVNKYPDSDTKTALTEFINYTTNRNK